MKITDRENVRSSVQKPKNSENQLVRKVTQAFDLDYLRNSGAGDGVTEMIYGIGMVITYGDSARGLRRTYIGRQKLTVSNKGSMITIDNTLPDAGIIPKIGPPRSTSNEDRNTCTTDSKAIVKMLQDLSEKKISQCCKELEAKILEEYQKMVMKYSKNLWEALRQYQQGDRLFLNYTKLVSDTVKSFNKDFLEIKDGMVKRLVLGCGSIVKKFSDDLAKELVHWYRDGLIHDAGELEAEFNKEMEELRNITSRKIIKQMDDRIRYVSKNCELETLEDFEKIRKKFSSIEDPASTNIEPYLDDEKLEVIRLPDSDDETSLLSSEEALAMLAITTKKAKPYMKRAVKFADENEVFILPECGSMHRKNVFKKIWNSVKKMFFSCIQVHEVDHTVLKERQSVQSRLSLFQK